MVFLGDVLDMRADIAAQLLRRARARLRSRAPSRKAEKASSGNFASTTSGRWSPGRRMMQSGRVPLPKRRLEGIGIRRQRIAHDRPPFAPARKLRAPACWGRGCAATPPPAPSAPSRLACAASITASRSLSRPSVSAWTCVPRSIPLGQHAREIALAGAEYVGEAFARARPSRPERAPSPPPAAPDAARGRGAPAAMATKDD